MKKKTCKQRKKSPHKETLTVPEASKILGVGKNAGYAAARTGQIPTIRIGRRLLVPKLKLRRLLEA